MLIKQICKFKALDIIALYYFCFRSVSKDFTNNKMSKISLKSTVYDFSTGYVLIGKQNILNIHEYLM